MVSGVRPKRGPYWRAKIGMATWRILPVICGATAMRRWTSEPPRAAWWWALWKTAASIWKRCTDSTTARCAGAATIAGTSTCSTASSCCGLALCKEAGFAPKSVGIDTWGVDFVLLDADDNLVGDAVAYRDERTQGMFEVADAIMSPEELYRRTGIQRQPFNTIYQFLALQRENPEQLEAAETFLMIPDYLGFLLTGEKALEYTNASTTGLLNAETGAWDETVLARFNIPRRLFRNVTMAGACLGPVKPSIAEKIGYDTCVVLPATHDTGSAFLAVPACDLPAVFLSSGHRGACSAWRTAARSPRRRPTAKTSPRGAATTSGTAS